MEELLTESFMLIYPAPGVTHNLTRRPLTPEEKICRNLQRNFRVKKYAALEIGDVGTIIFGVLVFIIAVDIIYTFITRRKHQPKTPQNVNMANSDRQINLGIVVVTFMAQITRPTKILDSIHYAYAYGTYGCIFAPTNSALALTFFVLLFLEFRTKAPGARTIAQFVRGRFGPIAHILTIFVTLMTSIYTLIINVNLGSMVMNVASVSVGRTAMVSLAFILVGALLLMAHRKSFGTIICLFVLTILCITAFFMSIVANVAAFKPLDNTNSFYKLLLCFDNSKKGFETSPTMEVRMEVMANNLVNFFHSIVRIFMDQAIWETLVYLPPNHGIIGLLLAILMAFCIPVALGIVCGLGFRALESAFFNERLLNEIQIQSEFMIYAVPLQLLDKGGLVVVFLVILLALITSCVFSISGASSILYYDVLATYIKPFKKQADPTKCLLCGKRRGQLASQRNICRCRSMLECTDCQTDTWVKNACRTRPSSAIVYGCRTHGAYRAYTDEMSSSVLQIAFTITAGMIPIFNMLNQTTILSTVYFGLCTSFVGCLCLSIIWDRLTKIAFLVGYFVNSAITMLLIFVLEIYSGLHVQYSRLIGLSVGIFGGFLLPILITLITTRPLPPEVALSAWSSVQEIDNPLTPWPEVFTRQTDLRFSPRLSEKKPALGEVRRALASLRRLASGIAIFYVIIFLGLWQILGFFLQNLGFDQFYFFVSSIDSLYESLVNCIHP
ncbi:unnamed protein product [Hymenolepis diminuta]|uniref:Solute carrier family 5 member 8 n=1 Tax=Hymenolepis diminuta TaxID=6216 RepID=A0A0R3SVE7_HYMDI|nr:unnamed protein product [Hymenolepis diminuta]